MFDANIPVTNPLLLSAIESMHVNPGKETESLFFTELKKAYFLSPVTITPKPEAADDGKVVLAVDTTISFLSFSGDQGTFLPVFTDWGELQRWRIIPDEQTIITQYYDLCAMIEREEKYCGFVINPYGCNMLISREIILYDKHPVSTPYVVENETEVLIGTPSDYPHELTEAVSRYLEDQINVKSAYLMLMNKNGEFSYLIVVDFTGDKNATFGGIASVAVPILKKGELLDMVPFYDSFGADAVKNQRPFYERG